MKRENIFAYVSKGVMREGRVDARAGKIEESRQRYCERTEARTWAEVLKDADVFLDGSADRVLGV